MLSNKTYLIAEIRRLVSPCLGALSCCLLFAGALLAQNDDFELTPELEQRQANQIQEMGMIDVRNFDSWVFGNEQAMTLKAEPAQLSVMLAELDRLCSISEEQKQKLKLAAEMDLKSFLDDVAAARQEFLKFKTQQEVFADFYNSVIRPLSLRRTSGFLGRNSLFARVIVKTLTPEQLKIYEEAQSERRRFQYRSTIDAALLSLQDATGLTGKQHEALAELILKETSPPLNSGRQERQYVYYQLSQLSEAQLNRIVPEKESKKIKQLVQPYAGMKQSLISMGMLPER